MKAGIIPGSLEEEKSVAELMSLVRDYVDELDYTKIPVYTWAHECKLVINGVEDKCIHQPYSSPLKLEFRSSDVLHLKNTKQMEDVPSGKVIVLDYPQSYWELRVVVYKLARRKPKAIVLVAPSDYLKMDVVLGSPGLSMHSSATLPVCVISVPAHVVSDLLGNHQSRIEVEATSTLAKSEGTVVVARVNGSGEHDVHLVAHHDTLVGEFKHATSSMLPRILRRLRDLSLKFNVVAISYTAREVGDASFTEYHFTWGEKYLLSVLDAKGILDRVAYAIGLGPIHGDTDLVAHSHPVFEETLAEHVSSIDYNHLFMESHFYMEHGVPAFTITTLPRTWSIHNSSAQPAHTESAVVRVANIVFDVLSKVKPNDEWFKKTRRSVYEQLGETRLEAKIAMSRLLDASARYGSWTGLREVTKGTYGVFGIACTNPLSAEANSGLGVVLSERTLNTIEKSGKLCHEDLFITTREYTMIIPGGTKLFLDGYLEYWLRKTEFNINQMVLKALCRLGE
ncbi:MAG: hypothetical protein QXS14_04210 [Desulfurococcaceae archaeon]